MIVDEYDDYIGRMLVESATAATWHNKTGRSLCKRCGIWYLDLNAYFDHIRTHHPSAGRPGGAA